MGALSLAVVGPGPHYFKHWLETRFQALAGDAARVNQLVIPGRSRLRRTPGVTMEYHHAVSTGSMPALVSASARAAIQPFLNSASSVGALAL